MLQNVATQKNRRLMLQDCLKGRQAGVVVCRKTDSAWTACIVEKENKCVLSRLVCESASRIVCWKFVLILANINRQ